MTSRPGKLHNKGKLYKGVIADGEIISSAFSKSNDSPGEDTARGIAMVLTPFHFISLPIDFIVDTIAIPFDLTARRQAPKTQ